MPYPGSPVKGQDPGEAEERDATADHPKLRLERKSVPVWND